MVYRLRFYEEVWSKSDGLNLTKKNVSKQMRRLYNVIGGITYDNTKDKCKEF